MDLLTSITILYFVSSLALFLYLCTLVSDVRNRLTDVLHYYNGEEIEGNHEDIETDSSDSVAVQEHVEKRESAFNERIARLKDELAYEQEMPDKRGTTAEIYHAGVYNMDWDDNKNTQTKPPEEEYSQ